MTRQARRANAREHAPRELPRLEGIDVREQPAGLRDPLPRGEAVLESLALALLSGILLAAPFLVQRLWWLHYGALVPWVLLLTHARTRRSWLYFFAGAYAFFIMATGPFSLFHKAVPFVAAAFYAPFLVPFAVVVRRLHVRFRPPLTLLVPVAWVATEWLRVRYSIGQAALFPLGSSQFAHTNLIQIADLTGVAGISFVVAAANGALADVIVTRGRWSWRTLWPAACFPLLLAATLLYGRAREAGLRLSNGPRAAVVQPNAVHYRDPRRAFATFEEQVRFTRSQIVSGSSDVIAWPENAIDEPFSDDPRYLLQLQDLARHEAAHLLVGTFTWAESAPGHVHTSAYYLSPEGLVLGRYDKLHLIPWAEYVPFTGWLGRANRALAATLLGYGSRGVPGSELLVFPIRTEQGAFHFAVPICFEVSSSGFARAATSQGADFLVNITSEGMLGPPVYVHMLAHATLRAVENRVAVVRVGNNGISGFIDPGGRATLLRSQTSGVLFREAGTLVAPVPLDARGAGTFYTRHGDLLAYLCAAATLAAFTASFIRRRSSAASAPGTESRP